MDFGLTDEQRMLRDETLRFAREKLATGVAERDRSHTFPHDLWLACGEMGFQGLPVPEEYGGSGLDALSTAIALDALGYGSSDAGLVFSIGAHLLSCVIPVWRFGTEDQRRRYLPGLCNGTLIAVNAMSEPGSGSDAFAMTTRAVADGDEFVINGSKTFASNGPVADVALTFAVTDPDKGYHGGITAFLVDTDSEGFQAGQPIEKMGLRTSPMCELFYDDVRVPASAMLGGLGGGSRVFTHSMDWERTCLFASHVGTIERLLDRAVEYARTRKQGGRAIGRYQAIAHRIADMKIHLEAARLLTYKAAWALDHSRLASMDASIAKVFVSDSLIRTAMDTLQIFGGYGFMMEYEVERAVRDAMGSRIYSGTSEIQRNIIARWLGLQADTE